MYLKIEIFVIYFIIYFHRFLLEHRFKKILLFVKIIIITCAPDNKPLPNSCYF